MHFWSQSYSAFVVQTFCTTNFKLTLLSTLYHKREQRFDVMCKELEQIQRTKYSSYGRNLILLEYIKILLDIIIFSAVKLAQQFCFLGRIFECFHSLYGIFDQVLRVFLIVCKLNSTCYKIMEKLSTIFCHLR